MKPCGAYRRVLSPVQFLFLSFCAFFFFFIFFPLHRPLSEPKKRGSWAVYDYFRYSRQYPRISKDCVRRCLRFQPRLKPKLHFLFRYSFDNENNIIIGFNVSISSILLWGCRFSSRRFEDRSHRPAHPVTPTSLSTWIWDTPDRKKLNGHIIFWKGHSTLLPWRTCAMGVEKDEARARYVVSFWKLCLR